MLVWNAAGQRDVGCMPGSSSIRTSVGPHFRVCYDQHRDHRGGAYDKKLPVFAMTDLPRLLMFDIGLQCALALCWRSQIVGLGIFVVDKADMITSLEVSCRFLAVS